MSDTNWQKVREIFDSALRRQPEGRRKFVYEVCGDDKTLLAEVESLLSSHDSAESFMETPAVARVADVIETKTKKLAAGKRFGHYEIIKQIGEGGMGEVYLAKDKKLNRKVAIKILNEEFSQDESNLQRFVSEAKAASALNHPNILTIYEFGEADDARFIVSEYIEGKTLREIIRASRLTVPEILDISIQIVGALSSAHKANLVHRDIKPENIMVRPDGYVKVLDFGLAKLVEQKNKSILGSEEPTVRQNLTAKGVILGTVNYMSPEQAKGERIDERTDIFSLGVMLYEMLTGKPPFEGGNAIETLGSILNKDPVPLSRETPEVPHEIERIINKALRKDREERYQTAKDLLIDLKDIRQDLQFQNQLERTASPNKEEPNTQILNAITADVAHTTSSAEYVANEIRSHKRSVLAILSILLLGVSGLGYWFYSNRSSLVNSKEINSIAVLPFENASGDANFDYLADGLSESVIDRLSQLPQLKVIARSSSFKYRGEKFDLKDVANKLGVQAIVTGRLVQRADDLIIRIEMVDARENKQLWGETFNRRTIDAPAVQEEIARTVSEKLSLKLSGEQETQLAKRETENPQAYELMLKARFYINKGGRKQAVEHLQQAIALDPHYALAYAQLSIVYSQMMVNSLLDPKEGTPKAESAARKALELDKNLSDAHLALAILKLNAWEWAEAGREFKRVFELNPNNSGAHQLYSNYLSCIGQHELAVAESKRAKELDPLSPFTNANIGITLFSARRFDEAIEHLKKILELDPNFSRAHVFLGYNYAAKGMYPEAINRYQEAIKSGSTSSSIRIYLGVSYARNGQREQAQAILKRLETSKDYVSPGELANLYAALDERDQAFVLLERAYAEHDPQLRFLNAEGFDVLRDDSRFQDLLRRVGLPQ